MKRLACVLLAAFAVACSPDSSGLGSERPTTDPADAVRALRGGARAADEDASTLELSQDAGQLEHADDSGAALDSSSDAELAQEDAAAAAVDGGQIEALDASSAAPDAGEPPPPPSVCVTALLSVCTTSGCGSLCEWHAPGDSGFSCCEDPAHPDGETLCVCPARQP